MNSVPSNKHGGTILRDLDEYEIRKLCGEAIYGAGQQDYLLGRVSEKRFSNDRLSGKVDESGRKWLSGSDAPFFEPTITLERKNNSKKIHAYGYCACSFAKEGSLCPHIAALMVAWVRKREEFEERVNEKDIEKARTRVIDSAKELSDLVTKEGTGSTDLEVLRKTYSKLRIWTDEVKEADSRNEKASLRDFSSIINCISLSLMSAIETKYEIKAVDLYNRNTVSTFGKVLNLLAEKNLVRRSNLRKERKLRS